MILLSTLATLDAPPEAAPFVSVEIWRKVFDGPNRTAADQKRAWRPVLERLRTWTRTAPAGIAQIQFLTPERMARVGFYRGATGVDLAWTATPIPTGVGRTFVFGLVVSKRVDAGLLPTRSAYAVVEPSRACLLPLVPAHKGQAVCLSAARQGRILAVAGLVLPNPSSKRQPPFATVFRLQGGEWHTVARRVDPLTRRVDPFQTLARISENGVPFFSLQKELGGLRFQTFETWRLRGTAIRTLP